MPIKNEAVINMNEHYELILCSLMSSNKFHVLVF